MDPGLNENHVFCPKQNNCRSQLVVFKRFLNVKFYSTYIMCVAVEVQNILVLEMCTYCKSKIEQKCLLWCGDNKVHTKQHLCVILILFLTL